ncbi:hypothetical protein [Nocardioides sp. GY 10127]|uniref:hypothetical protein n=1 Tax=Nocardioides sp. GY 10127 TaxID=2569762 RepID=UPI0010A778BF|nr:hypothetical protein [Nocardioides sp. GY 10127]TIC80109.1 hypothetical protein E8D37_15995 [Nocardioides sp. GY 10127]
MLGLVLMMVLVAGATYLVVRALQRAGRLEPGATVLQPRRPRPATPPRQPRQARPGRERGRRAWNQPLSFVPPDDDPEFMAELDRRLHGDGSDHV